MFVPFSPPLQRWQSMFSFELALEEFLLLETIHVECKLLATLKELIFWSPISTFHHCLAESTEAGITEKSIAIGTSSYTREKLQEVQGIVILGLIACSVLSPHCPCAPRPRNVWFLNWKNEALFHDINILKYFNKSTLTFFT